MLGNCFVMAHVLRLGEIRMRLVWDHTNALEGTWTVNARIVVVFFAVFNGLAS